MLDEVLLESAVILVYIAALRALKVSFYVDCRAMVIQLRFRSKNFSTFTRKLLDSCRVVELLVRFQGMLGEERNVAKVARVLHPRLDIHVGLNVLLEIMLDTKAFAAEIAHESDALRVDPENVVEPATFS